MKKSRIIFAAAFVLAIGSAFTLPGIVKNKPFTTRYQINGLQQCVSFQTSACDGPTANPVCSNTFVNSNCTGETYQTTAR